jgi:NTE family protein
VPGPAPSLDGPAFVLGGGGQLGAHEVGMLRALVERDVRPSVVLGTSVGAINGVAFAADPSVAAVERLAAMWSDIGSSDVFGGSVLGRLGTLARSRTHLHDNERLRAILTDALPVERIEDLAVPFQCVAASIERASEHWFCDGPIVDAVLASCAVPGLLPPVEIAGEHFVDGGVVNSIPVSRALELGAREVYVLHVGRLDRPLEPPRWPWEVGLVAFEIARRHRFLGDLARLPEDVRVHVMPTGQQDPPRYNDLAQLRYRDPSKIAARIASAHAASLAYLDAQGGSGA